MKISLWLLCLLPWAAGAAVHQKIIIGVKLPTTRQQVRKTFERESLVFSCDLFSAEKKVYYGATYTGKNNVQAYMEKLRKDKRVKMVDLSQDVQRTP